MKDDSDWVDVPNLNGLYQANKSGEVRGIHKRILNGNSVFGYTQLTIRINNKPFKMFAHRLIALTFIPNPENKPQVNHLDFNRKNNAVSNLIWSTSKEDAEHKVLNNRQAKGMSFKSRKRENGPCSKIVINTQTGIFYGCVQDAADSICRSYSFLQARLCGFKPNNTPFKYA